MGSLQSIVRPYYSSFCFFLKQRSGLDLNFWRLTMLMSDEARRIPTPVNGSNTLTRNNIEFAGVVVYFFALAIIFAITIIVMLTQSGNNTNEKAVNDHQPKMMAISVNRL
jgi:hypothetical protein